MHARWRAMSSARDSPWRVTFRDPNLSRELFRAAARITAYRVPLPFYK